MKIKGYIIALENKGMIYYFDRDEIGEHGTIVLRFSSNIHKASIFKKSSEADEFINRLMNLGSPLRSLLFSDRMYVDTSTLIWDFEGKEDLVGSIKVLEIKRSIKTKLVMEGIKS